MEESDGCATSRDFASVKMEYFKTRAREALGNGNYKEAYATYTKCLEELAPRDAGERAKLLCNRSMAYAKSANFKAALEDASAAVSMMPTFAKGWWRKATAHVGLRQFPDALAAYRQSFECQDEGDAGVIDEHVKAMNKTITSFTREQLANWILETLQDMENRELIEHAHLENVTSLEMAEGMFCQIKGINEGSKPRGDYYRFVQHWNVHGMSVPMAYTQRASMYRHALCFMQARADAAAALTLLQDDASLSDKETEMTFTYKVDDFSPFKEDTVITKAWAWYEMGKAFEGRENGDTQAAAKCFSAITHLDTKYPMFTNAFKNVCSRMTDVEAGKILSDINDQYGVAEYGVRTVPDALATYVVTVSLLFKTGKLVGFNSKVRDSFRENVAKGANVIKEKVLIESVRSRFRGAPGVALSYRILAGEDKLNSEVRV